MGELGRFVAKSTVEQNLLGGIADVIFAANHMGDAHVDVIHHHRQVVERVAIRSGNDHVSSQILGVPGNGAADEIHPRHFQGLLDFEADHRLPPLGFVGSSLGFGEKAVAVVVAGGFAGGLLGSAHLLQLRLADVAAVGQPSIQKLLYHRLIALDALGLVDRPFVPV